jgi:hypothetical protein
MRYLKLQNAPPAVHKQSNRSLRQKRKDGRQQGMRSTTFLILRKLPIFDMDVVMYKLPQFLCMAYYFLGHSFWFWRVEFGSDIPHFVNPFGYVKYIYSATARQLASLSIWKAKLRLV